MYETQCRRWRLLNARSLRRAQQPRAQRFSLAGEMKRYQAGMSTTFLIFQFEDQLVTARTAELRAEANYNQALANLQRATATTLRANRVTVDVRSDDHGFKLNDFGRKVVFTGLQD
jgi:outer membrane protein TolC